jgi:YD repeat-containing protein
MKWGFYFAYAGRDPEARCVHTWGDEGIYNHTLVYDVEAKRTVVTNSLGHATTYQGNENGLVVEKWDARGGVTLTEYTDYNELLRKTDPLGYATTNTYDERGNCLTTTTPDGAQVQRAYDAQDQLVALTDAVGGRWQWAYDAAGNLSARTNPLGNTERYEYANGLLVHLVERGQRFTELTYDAAHNLVAQRLLDNQPSRWLCDGWGRTSKLIDTRGNVQWREYDLLGRVVTLHEPDGNIRRLTYDGLNNVVRMQDRHYDVQYYYKGLGRLIRRVEAGASVEFWHDTEEQLRAVVNEHGLAYRFERDRKGDIIVETGFDGLTRSYQRDQAGQVVEAELPTG